MTEEKRKLKIDMSELAFALNHSPGQISYYLDIETGAVMYVTVETELQLERLTDRLGSSPDALDAVLNAIREDTQLQDWQKQELTEAAQINAGYEERYIPVPFTNSRAGYEDMEAVIDTVEDAHLRERLEDAIQGRGAFRRFKNIVENHPTERERWFQFKAERLRQRVLRWPNACGIEPP